MASLRIEPLEARIAPAFGATLNLAVLGGDNGFRMESGRSNDNFGASVSVAGDVNGDGFDDFIVGAPGIEFDAGYGQVRAHGSSYVVFGREDGFPRQFTLADLDGVSGFRLEGETKDFAGQVSAAGDFNGDGFDDLLIGAPGGYPYFGYCGYEGCYETSHSVRPGRVYIVFGKASGFAAVVRLGELDGTDGFRIIGKRFEQLGDIVNAAGDVNGDGFDDVIFSHAEDYAFVLFGQAGRVAASRKVTKLNEADGFVIDGYRPAALDGAGDINGDGFDDLIVGAPYSTRGERCTVIFGKADGFGSFFDLHTMDATDGFRVDRSGLFEYVGWAASGAGDLNGDGLDDLIVGSKGDGSPPDRFYVVFGQSGGFPLQFDPSALDGSNGFRLDGFVRGGGQSLSALGDFNGDGLDDVVLGGYQQASVLFGRSDGFPPTLDVANLDGRDGFTIVQNRGRELGNSVSGGGDINGDGIADLVLGDKNAAYVVFGGPGNGHFTGRRTAHFLDADGDLAKVKVSRGAFTLDDFILAGDEGEVAGVDLTRAVFAGASLTISAHRTALGGDGRIDLGVLDATGIDLGHVRIDGDLGRIVAGDGDEAAPALLSLHVRSMGLLGVETGGALPLESVLNGDVGRLESGLGGLFVRGSIRDVTIHVAGDLARFSVGRDFVHSKLTVRGDLETPTVRAARTVGSIDVGGDVDHAQLLIGYHAAGTPANGDVRVGLVQVGGDWIASDFTAGVRAGADGSFGTQDDNTIARVNIFGAVFDLDQIDGVNGFRMGEVQYADLTGAAVSRAGDVNGDGIDDFIVGAPETVNAENESGAAYVVFGRTGGFSRSFDLATLDGTNGFRIDGVAGTLHAGIAVSDAGDINGDGYDDLVVGALGSYSSRGADFVVFGKATAFTPVVRLANLNGSDGFRINGAVNGDGFGRAVSGAGDINGDGFDDLILAAPYFRSAGSGATCYVFFGRGTGFNAVIDVSSLDGTTGFRIDGNPQGLGRAVSGAGDVNGDGLDDLIVSARSGGIRSAYVVFGRNTGFPAAIEVDGLDGSNGFRIEGVEANDVAGSTVAGGGDVNGDGFADLIVGTPYGGPGNEGAAYVVFGRAAGFTPVVGLDQLDGANGFQLLGTAGFDETGSSVSFAGDLNGDGLDDLVVGADYAPGGAAYVVYGKAGSFAPQIRLADLDGHAGFQILGNIRYRFTARFSVADAGDVNSDGFDDLLVGEGQSGNGAAYVIFGDADLVPVAQAARGGGEEQDITSRIAGVIIHGRVVGTTAAGDHFGIVAEEIVRLQVGQVALRLRPGAHNDHQDRGFDSYDGHHIGSTGDVTVRESFEPF